MEKDNLLQKIGKENPSLCHDVDLNVDTVVARSRVRGATLRLQALEPRALIPERQEKNGCKRLKAVAQIQNSPFFKALPLNTTDSRKQRSRYHDKHQHKKENHR